MFGIEPVFHRKKPVIPVLVTSTAFTGISTPAYFHAVYGINPDIQLSEHPAADGFG